jgi:tetratricopeptide (TPR) repeat protein
MEIGGESSQASIQVISKRGPAFHQLPIWAVSSALFLLVIAAVFLIRWDQHTFSPNVSGGRSSSSLMRHVPAPGAEELYFRGRYFCNLRTADGLSKAIDAYTQAIVKDPSYAEAYAGLAEAYDLVPQFAHADLADSFTRAKDAADRAIQLDPNLAAAHCAKAFALFFWDWDIKSSDAEFQRALALDPDSAQTHHWYASTLLNRLEGTESLRQIDAALRLTPASAAVQTDAALIHAEFGSDPGAGIKALLEMESTQPTLATPSYFLREIDFAQGDYPAYIAEAQHYAAITHDPDDIASAESAARGWAKNGRAGLLEGILVAQKLAFWRGSESGFRVGESYLLLGRQKDALPYFKAALNQHYIMLMTMPDCNFARRLAGDPAYAAFFAQIRARVHGTQPAHPSVVPITFRLPQ